MRTLPQHTGKANLPEVVSGVVRGSQLYQFIFAAGSLETVRTDARRFVDRHEKDAGRSVQAVGFQRTRRSTREHRLRRLWMERMENL